LLNSQEYCIFAAVFHIHQTEYERTLHYPAVAVEQHLHDAGMVRTPETARVGYYIFMASSGRHRLLMGHRFLRILLPSAGKQTRIHWQRRTLLAGTAEGGAGMYIAGGICCHSKHHVPEPPPLEPHTGLPAHHLCRVPGVYEMTADR